MTTSAPEILLALYLTVVFLGLLVELSHFDPCPATRGGHLARSTAITAPYT